ncbi:MAG TPA: DNA polymerase III subunit beta [Myxococcales bacterium]|nr:DNA polymerase III subunit beta [Myxococcales bacterium]
MEFTVKKQDIAAGLYKAQGVVDRKSTVNILSHVLIESVSNTQIRLTCTDYDVVLTGDYSADVTQPGKIAVGAKSLFEVIKVLPDEPIHINSMENHWIELTCGSSRFKLAGLPPEDFPERQDVQDLKYFSIPKRLFLDLIDRTLFSVSHDETRPSLNGAFCRVMCDGDEMRVLMASTDGHRLSKAEILGGSSGDFVDSGEAIIHHKAINELKRCMEGPDEDIRIAFNNSNIHFACDEISLQVRELDDAFPDYSKVIPTTNSINIELDRSEFQAAVRRISTLTSAKTHIIRMEIAPGKVILTSSNPEAGEGHDELPTQYSGEGVAVGFNHRYLQDVLSVIDGEKVIFSINDQYATGLLTSPDDEGSLFVIMPMRI